MMQLPPSTCLCPGPQVIFNIQSRRIHFPKKKQISDEARSYIEESLEVSQHESILLFSQQGSVWGGCGAGQPRCARLGVHWAQRAAHTAAAAASPRGPAHRPGHAASPMDPDPAGEWAGPGACRAVQGPCSSGGSSSDSSSRPLCVRAATCPQPAVPEPRARSLDPNRRGA